MEVHGTGADDGAPIDRLPDEVLVLAFSFLPCLELRRAVSAACRRWRAIVQDERTVRSCIRGSRRKFRICAAAARAGHARCLADAMARGRRWGPKAIKAAVVHGHPHIVRMFIETGYTPGPDMTRAAVRSRRLAMVRYLVEQERCPFDDDVVEDAACAGDIELLMYLLGARDVADRSSVIEQAMYSGRLDMVKELRRRGFAWSTGACAWAARGGRLACLRYAHEDGCPWDESTPAQAAGGGHLE
jgi:hypothetical protein